MCCGSEQEVHWTRRLRVQGYSPSGALGGTRLVGGARSTIHSLCSRSYRTLGGQFTVFYGGER